MRSIILLLFFSLNALAWGPGTLERFEKEAAERDYPKHEFIKKLYDSLEDLEDTDASKVLTVKSVKMLCWAKDPYLSDLVYKSLVWRFGKSLKGYKKDLKYFTAAIEYLTAVKYKKAVLPFTRSMLQMKHGGRSGNVIYEFLEKTVDKDKSCPAELMDEILNAYSKNIYYYGGPGRVLNLFGNEKAVAKLIEIMTVTPVRTKLKQRKSDVYSVISSIIKPEYEESITRLVKLVGGEDDDNSSYAMGLLEKYENEELNAALIRIAADTGRNIWVRNRAIISIGRRKLYGSKKLIEEIGKEEYIHQAVAIALKDVGDKASIPLLASYLKENKDIGMHAAEAIGKIINIQFTKDEKGIAAAKAWWEKNKKL